MGDPKGRASDPTSRRLVEVEDVRNRLITLVLEEVSYYCNVELFVGCLFEVLRYK